MNFHKLTASVCLGFFILGCGGGKGQTSVKSGGPQDSRPGQEKPFEGKPKNFDGFWKGNGNFYIDGKPGPVELQLSISGFPEAMIINYTVNSPRFKSFSGKFTGASIFNNEILDIDGKVIGKIGKVGFAMGDIFENIDGRFKNNQSLEVSSLHPYGRSEVQIKAFLRKLR